MLKRERFPAVAALADATLQAVRETMRAAEFVVGVDVTEVEANPNLDVMGRVMESAHIAGALLQIEDVALKLSLLLDQEAAK